MCILCNKLCLDIEILEEIMYLVNQGTVKMNLINIESTSRYIVLHGDLYLSSVGVFHC